MVYVVTGSFIVPQESANQTSSAPTHKNERLSPRHEGEQSPSRTLKSKTAIQSSSLNQLWHGEQPIQLNEVPRHVPKRKGKYVNYSTVYRWATKGVRGRKLESKRVGGVYYTTLEALQRFQEQDSQRLPEIAEQSAIDAILTQSGM